jgi:hypothetical protein
LSRYAGSRALSASHDACTSPVRLAAAAFRLLPRAAVCETRLRTVKSKPGSVSCSESAYFQSMRSRTASAACRSDKSSI